MPLPPLPPDLQNKTAKAAYGRCQPDSFDVTSVNTNALGLFSKEIQLFVATRVNMHFVSTLFDSMGVMAASSAESNTPLTFEALNQVGKPDTFELNTFE